MPDKYYFGRNKNIKDESVNKYLEINKDRFNSLMFLISSFVRKNPQTELSNRYTSNVSHAVGKFRKVRTNTIKFKVSERIDRFVLVSIRN